MMLNFLPMAIGAGVGALTKKDPLAGAAQGAVMGGLTGGLGGLGGATQAVGGLGLQAGGGAMAGTTGMGEALGSGLLSQTGGAGLKLAAGTGTQLSAAGAPAATGGIFGADTMKTVGNVAGLAGQMGVLDDGAAPQAQSAGIPGRGGVDFTGLMSAGKANNVAGAQKLLQQQAARRGRG